MIFVNYRTNFNSSFANRGMALENDINETNKYYREYDIALVYKKPTPIRITKTNYQNMRVTDGFFECPSTLDYNGVYKGKYLDFEAKSTRSKTSFPLANIPSQQIEHLKNVIFHKGIAFFLINLHCFNKTYLIDASIVIDYYENRQRASIPFKDLEEKGYLVKESYRPRLDYLSILDEHFL